MCRCECLAVKQRKSKFVDSVTKHLWKCACLVSYASYVLSCSSLCALSAKRLFLAGTLSSWQSLGSEPKSRSMVQKKRKRRRSMADGDIPKQKDVQIKKIF